MTSYSSLSVWETYWAALGRFVHEFSIVERILPGLLYQQAELYPNEGNALLSGAKTDTLINLLNRLLDTQGRVQPEKLEVKAALEPIFAQLSLINSVRNKLLHHGADLDEKASSMSVSTIRKTHLSERAEQIPISAEILADLSHDLEKIQKHLLVIKWPSFSSGDPAYEVHFRELIEAPWRYKQPAQASRREKSPKPSRKQKPPPQSSGG